MNSVNVFTETKSSDLQKSENSIKSSGQKYYFLFFPLIILFLSFSGLFIESELKNSTDFQGKLKETGGGKIKNTGKFNILTSDDNSSAIKDTVYTNLDNWLELRIDKQMLYQHWRDGRVLEYPVSTGNKTASDPEALESRPGVFAVFHKVLHHQSTQFNAANMYHFMPFNQGIGFHSIDGKAYYAHLGVRPSSHGCIRMRHDHAEKLFKETPLGTLVLASRGYSARTIGFVERDFQNDKKYEKNEVKYMLANNLYNLANGRYYLEDRIKFVPDPKYIPVSGIYNGYDLRIPVKQIIPRNFTAFYNEPDKLNVVKKTDLIPIEFENELEDILISSEENKEIHSAENVNSTNELIKEYFNNPIGVLPYFGPKR